MPVGELLNRITSAEMTEWAAHFRLVAEERAREERKQQMQSRMRR